MKCKNSYVNDTIKFYPKHAQIAYRISPTIKTTVLFPVDKVYNISVTKLGLIVFLQAGTIKNYYWEKLTAKIKMILKLGVSMQIITFLLLFLKNKTKETWFVMNKYKKRICCWVTIAVGMVITRSEDHSWFSRELWLQAEMWCVRSTITKHSPFQ